MLILSYLCNNFDIISGKDIDTKCIIMELQSSTENMDKINDGNRFFSEQEINTSTPLKSSTYPVPEIRMSDIDLSRKNDLDQSGSSCAPSLPSGLLEIIEDDWLHETSVETEILEHSHQLVNITDCADEIENRKNSFSECVNSCRDPTTDKIKNKNISKISQDLQDAHVNVLNFNYEHNYSKVRNEILFIDNHTDRLSVNTDNDELSVDSDTNVDINADADQIFIDTDTNADADQIVIDTDSDANSDQISIGSLKVQRSRLVSKTIIKKKIVSKQYFCLYCKILVTKFARHLETHHANIAEVKKFMKYPLRSAERNKAITDIRNRGTHLHNTSKIFNTGSLITSRRSQSGYNRTARHFEFCPYCKAYLAKTTLPTHTKKCMKKPEKILLKDKNIRKHGKKRQTNKDVRKSSVTIN